MTQRSSRWTSRDLALIAIFAGILAALGAIPAWYPFGVTVPITAQSLGVMLTGSVIGARRGFAALFLFLMLVAAGLPLLAGGRGGIAAFAGPSMGFLVAMPLGAWVVGAITERMLPRYTVPVGLVANLVGGVLVLYALGIPVVAWRADVSLEAALMASLVFLPGDLAKVVVATLVAKAVHAAYPRFAEEADERRRPVDRAL